MKKAYMTVSLRPLFLMLFIFCFGWGFLCEFLPVYVMHMLNFGAKEIGYTYGYIGLLIMLCQGLLIRPLINRLVPQKLLVVGLMGLVAFVPFLFITHTVSFYLIVLFFMVFFEALIFPAVSTLVSKLSDKKEQG
jgi:DHA1 family multidrug resistance protein-like MFS transporter